jgi:hypothetical protein
VQQIQHSEDEYKQKKTVHFLPIFQAGNRRGTLERAHTLFVGLSTLLNTLQLLSKYSINELKAN